jgi:hypothetical protein
MKKFTAFIACLMLLTMGCQLSAQGFDAPRAPMRGQEASTNRIDPTIPIIAGAAIATIVLLTMNDPNNVHAH